MRVCIDPGHAPGNVNGGSGYLEYQGMWKLSCYLKAALERCKAEVIITRAENGDPSLTARGQKAGGCDLFISEHSNAFDGKAQGVEVFYSVQVPSDKNLAAGISKAEAVLMNSSDRGAKTRHSTNSAAQDYYTVMYAARKAGCPHVLLVENGFHDNAKDVAFLKNNGNLRRLAEIQCEHICRALGVEYVAEVLPESKAAIGAQAVDFAGLSDEAAAAKILELVKPDAAKSGLFPSVKAAQLILESDYLRSELAISANNGYGMKKLLSGNTWQGGTWDGVSVYTKETRENKPNGAAYIVTADFRKYTSLEESIADHSAYLLGAKNGSVPRYAGVTQAPDYRAQITIIKEGGYATDIDYVAKLCGVIEKFELDRFDGEVSLSPEEVTVNNALSDGVIIDGQYWLNVLRGAPSANPEHIKVVLDRYHAKMRNSVK